MKYKTIFFILLLSSCSQNISKNNLSNTYYSKGFAYIYNEQDYLDKKISKRLNNELLEISNNKLRYGALIKIINNKTQDVIILKNKSKIRYPEFYKILITEKVAKKLNLDKEFPYVEILEIKKNKSFVAGEAKIFNEEKKIHSKAPVETVFIDNISSSCCSN